MGKRPSEWVGQGWGCGLCSPGWHGAEAARLQRDLILGPRKDCFLKIILFMSGHWILVGPLYFEFRIRENGMPVLFLLRIALITRPPHYKEDTTTAQRG